MKPPVTFSRAIAARIVKRVASGEAIGSICLDAGMPTRGTVSKWQRMYPAFAAAMARARRDGEWRGRTSQGDHYDPAIDAEIYLRVSLGESLNSVCRDPRMPGHSTVYRWMASRPDFRETLDMAHDNALLRRAGGIAQFLGPIGRPPGSG